MPERPKEMDEFLSSRGRMARVATVSKGGSPHVVPLVYKFSPEDGTFFISTGADSVTVRNLRRNPAISVCVDDEVPPFRAVLVEGKAQVSEVLGTDHEGLKTVVDEFFGPQMWATYQTTPIARKIRVRVTVIPERWKWWDFRRQLSGSARVE